MASVRLRGDFDAIGLRRCARDASGSTVKSVVPSNRAAGSANRWLQRLMKNLRIRALRLALRQASFVSGFNP